MLKEINKFGTCLLVALLMVSACKSSKTSKEGQADSTNFISTEPATGDIDLDVKNSIVTVSDTTSFSVKITDRNGAPVQNVRISCDTEQGLAIVEPNTGSFLTDNFGNASGLLGCEAAGSFRVGCRAPVGVNIREFDTVKCEGTRPIGFAGFPDAAGGGLGGGVDLSNDETENEEFALRILSISFNEVDQDDTKSIDFFQSLCDPDPVNVGDEFPEPFTETEVNFTIENNTNQIVRIEGFQYTIENYDNNGTPATSDLLNFIGEEDPVIDPNGGTVGFRGLFLEFGDLAPIGSNPNVGKTVPFDGPTLTFGTEGFKNVEFTLFGTNSSGEAETITARESISLNAFNRCG